MSIYVIPIYIILFYNIKQQTVQYFTRFCQLFFRAPSEIGGSTFHSIRGSARDGLHTVIKRITISNDVIIMIQTWKEGGREKG